MSTGLDSAARSAALVSEDPSSSALPICVEPRKSAPCIADVSRVFHLRIDGVPAAAISSIAGKKLIDWAMKLCQLWSTPQTVTHRLMTGPNEPSDPWEDFHLDAIERFCNDDDFESDDSWESTLPEPVIHAPSSFQICGRGIQQGSSISSLHLQALQAATRTLPLPSAHNARCDNPSFLSAASTTPPGFDYEAAVRQLLKDTEAAQLAPPAQHHHNASLALPRP